MSTLVRMVEEIRSGSTVDSVAARLGVPPELAEVMVAELARLGVVTPPTAPGRAACGPTSCTPDPASPRCAGCPLAGRRR